MIVMASPAFQVIVQQLVQANISEPLWRESLGRRWIPLPTCAEIVFMSWRHREKDKYRVASVKMQWNELEALNLINNLKCIPNLQTNDYRQHVNQCLNEHLLYD